MNKHLPEYIVNCFLAAGYDSMDVICEMNDNSVTEIEDYIEERKEQYPSCMRPGESLPWGSNFHLFTGSGYWNSLAFANHRVVEQK